MSYVNRNRNYRTPHPKSLEVKTIKTSTPNLNKLSKNKPNTKVKGKTSKFGK